jgi:hypothetical protein
LSGGLASWIAEGAFPCEQSCQDLILSSEGGRARII